jgi:hypothetical protein
MDGLACTEFRPFTHGRRPAGNPISGNLTNNRHCRVDFRLTSG